ncbi:Lrp/AsnC family transcriptional regulator [Mycobacterium dioxanotrophicus]|uniref:Lrp/AsnC family transcriptional regulator n=1 Tax=Mycobacterium dioxanotrophicus TaxID=482462 RepID=UPI001E4E1087|nr:Lrp/AsnC family transcriptional regulator [Mycobacterium dioxanotrophicus]
MASSLARRRESVVAHLTSGTADCFVDWWSPDAQLANLLGHELGAISGVNSFTVSPIMRYLRTVHDWQPNILTADEIDELRNIPRLAEWPQFSAPIELDRTGKYILKCLVEDGRRSFEDIALRSDVSEQTVNRRIDQMRTAGLLVIRALVDPALLGFPVGALLRIAPVPENFDTVVQAIQENPMVRYAVVVMGDYQIMAEVRASSRSELYDLMFKEPWFRLSYRFETSLILATLKQSGVLALTLEQ